MAVNKKSYMDGIVERGLWAMVPNELWERQDISTTAKMIWCYILSRRSDWSSSRNNLARNLGLGKRTVTDAIAELAGVNMLSVDGGEGSAWSFVIEPVDSWKPTANRSPLAPVHEDRSLLTPVGGVPESIDSGKRQLPESTQLHTKEENRIEKDRQEVLPHGFEETIRTELRHLMQAYPGQYITPVNNYVTEVCLRYGDAVRLSVVQQPINEQFRGKLSSRAHAAKQKILGAVAAAYDSAIDQWRSSGQSLLDTKELPATPEPTVVAKLREIDESKAKSREAARSQVKKLDHDRDEAIAEEFKKTRFRVITAEILGEGVQS